MINREDKTFELLDVFEFNSDRKRSSIIIRDNSGFIKLLTKGADNIIKARLHSERKQPFTKRISYQIDEWSKTGFRTLLMAMRVVTEEEYKRFVKEKEKYANHPERDAMFGKSAEEDIA